jgi:hypothetical protein
MPRTYSSIDKTRAELAWVTETPDPNKWGCRKVRYTPVVRSVGLLTSFPSDCRAPAAYAILTGAASNWIAMLAGRLSP